MSWYEPLLTKTHDEVGGCWGVVREAYRQHAIELPDLGVHDQPLEVARIADEVRRDWRERPKGDQPRSGDVVYFRGPMLAHVGVMVDGRTVLHSSRARGVVAEPLRSSDYYRFLDGVFYLD